MTDWTQFTRSGYSKILDLARDRYSIGPVSAYRDATAIWRHDVDCSPQGALALAKIEAKQQIRSTFYFNLRSDFYNVFEGANARIVSEILALGHELGLHVDSAMYSLESDADLEAVLEREQVAFSSMLGVSIDSFSFHNPGPHTVVFNHDEYAGLLNAYGPAVMNGRAYCSDSNGYWRFDELPAFLSAGHERVCVLTHPEWWPDAPMSPRDRIARCIDGRAAATLHAYDDLLATHGRKNLK